MVLLLLLLVVLIALLLLIRLIIRLILLLNHTTIGGSNYHFSFAICLILTPLSTIQGYQRSLYVVYVMYFLLPHPHPGMRGPCLLERAPAPP